MSESAATTMSLPTEASRKAGAITWLAAVVLLVTSTCCAGGVATMGLVPISELRAADTTNQVPAKSWDQLRTIQPTLPGVAVGIVLLTTLPAVILLVTGFGVRAGRRSSIRTALWTAWVPTFTLGFVLVLALPGSLAGGVPGVLSLLPMIGMVALLVWCVRTLRQAKSAALTAAVDRSPDDDPWEHLL